MDKEQYAGAVGESSNGSMGLIYKVKELRGRPMYVGVSFNGRSWGSRKPKIHAHTLKEYIANQIENEIQNERKAYLAAMRRFAKHSGNQDVIESCIDVINERAADRRESRKYAPQIVKESEPENVSVYEIGDMKLVEDD